MLNVGLTRIGGGGSAERRMEAMAGVRVQQSLHQGDAAFERSHPLPGYVRTAAWALLVCRTARWGGHIQAGPEGHVERVGYHACRHRLCPPCRWRHIELWLAPQQARLLGCDHDHLIFTRPEALRGLWRVHVKAMTDMVLATGRATLAELMGDANYLGARRGSSPRCPPGARRWCDTPIFTVSAAVEE